MTAFYDNLHLRHTMLESAVRKETVIAAAKPSRGAVVVAGGGGFDDDLGFKDNAFGNGHRCRIFTLIQLILVLISHLVACC
jgi:hypothetical protein